MTDGTVIVCGLPAAGKTTYLAALWDVLQDGGPKTELSLASRGHDDYAHVRKIHRRWIEGYRQERTEGSDRDAIGLDLENADGPSVKISFPDLGGEVFTQLWEERTCDAELSAMISGRRGVMLFIHADKINRPRHLIDELVDNEEMGEKPPDGEALPFKPKLAPSQVKLVDLLQSLANGAIGGAVGNLAIVLSAWDRVAVGDLTPERHLANQLPLLDQYLKTGEHGWRPAVFGISAQGTDYIKKEETKEPPKALVDICRLPKAYQRIRVVADGQDDHDLTRPIKWVVS